MKVHIIVNDDRNDTRYFIRVGLGVFWECSLKRDEAKEFPTRQKAADVLTKSGKHREGWRVISESKVNELRQLVTYQTRRTRT